MNAALDGQEACPLTEAEETRSSSPQWTRHDWLAALGYLAAAHLIFFPALRSGVFLFGTDTTGHDYGLLLYNWTELLEHGRLVLWNPHLFCGLPSLGTYAFCPFYPVTWLFSVLPFALAFTYQYVLNAWLAGLWTYWAARWMGLRRPAAFFAGLVFMVSGHFVTLAHAGHLQKFAAIAWLPFVFGCATAATRERRWIYWVGCGVGLAMQLLAAHAQIAYYTILFLGAWTLWLALRLVWSELLDDSSTSLVLRPLSFAIGGLAVALLVAATLSAAQILPGLETAPLSNRSGGVDFKIVTETSYPPLEFIEYLLPGFLGDSAGGPYPYWGQWGSERIVTDYMGLLPIVLLFYGLAVASKCDLWFLFAVLFGMMALLAGCILAGPDTPAIIQLLQYPFLLMPLGFLSWGLVASNRPNRWFWAAVIWAVALLAVGHHTRVFHAAYRSLPGFDHFRSPGTIMVFIAWPVAVLAGMGFDDFHARVAGDAACRRRYLAILGTAAVACAAALFLLGPSGAKWLDLAGDRGGRPVESIYASLQRSLLFAGLACAALGAVVATAYLCSRSARVACGLAVGALFVLAFVDPRLHEARYIKARDVRNFQLYLISHWSDSALRALPQPVRGIEIGNERSNRMMTRGIGSLHGYHPVHLQTYVDLLNLYADNHAQLGRLVFEQFVLAPAGTRPGTEYERHSAQGRQVLWLRRPPLLHAYFPQEVELAPDRETLLSAMARGDFNPYRHSYTLDPNLEYHANDGATATARLVVYAPNRIELEVASDEERPLVVAELAAPGWRWEGKREKAKGKSEEEGTILFPAKTANYAFRASRVPAGKHRIALIYRPFSFRLGLYLTLISVTVVCACGLARGRPCCRRSSPATRNQT